MSGHPGPVRRLWYSWKMLRLPWRSRWLVGFDLEGNTFWEFKDALHSNRTRRIVKYRQWTHYGDVNVPPQWMQWLRHTRFEPPSLAEQQADIARQERMKLLAQAADARWAAKPSALDAPDKQQPVQMLESRDWNTGVKQTNVDQEIREKAAPQQPAEAEATPHAQQENEAPTLKKKKRMRAEPKDSPWKKAAPSNPGDQWQPDSWSPAPARRRE